MSPVATFPLSRPVAISELQHGEARDLNIDANADERGALAAFLGIPEVRAVTARVRLRAEPGRRFSLDGTLKAELVQTCVVTLDPLETRVEGPIRRLYQDAAADAEDAEMDPFDDDSPDPVEGGVIDAGAALCEHIALEMEPYPRRGDAPEPETPASDGEPEDGPRPDNPFAILAQTRDLEK